MTAVRTTTRFALLAATVAASVLLSRDIAAYTMTGEFWSRSSVDYRVNPVNLDLPESAVTAAVRAGADAWAQQSQAAVDVEIEGGTIGDLTLRVSDLSPVAPGDRAVFYLERTARGALVPHLRGQGMLRLDRSNRVPGSSLTLDEIRRTVADARSR